MRRMLREGRRLAAEGPEKLDEPDLPFAEAERSLRDLDLTNRLLQYPCSYLIYSPAFDGLPASVKERVYRRLWDVLTGKETGKDYAHLTAADRTAIREILMDTKDGLPAYWKG